MAYIPINKALAKTDNPFELVLLASVRTNALESGAEPMLERIGTSYRNTVWSLVEMNETDIDTTKLRHDLSKRLNPNLFLEADDAEESLAELLDDDKGDDKGEL